ncbi:hypothetical protein [Plantibacter sp. MMLR14_011]|uniref:hypothetical protein n=1 Tax=Plantibacter sp. MMLR14_011 TaxID=1898746 RepID=UPI001113E109|nr:hypothetical protein [Plantibacter sp. MMLR14_011]
MASLEADVEDGAPVWRARMRDLPAHWPVILGDAVHNARSALDHLAWQLVVKDGGNPSRRTQFPIAGTPADLAKRVKNDLSGCSLTTKNRVRQLQPFKDGTHSFWALNELDNWDKHRLLLPVFASPHHLTLSTTLIGGDEDGESGPPISFRGAGLAEPTADGQVVAPRQEPLVAIDADGWGFMTDAIPSFVLAFGEGSPYEGEEVSTAVIRMIDEIQEAVENLVSTLHAPRDGS